MLLADVLASARVAEPAGVSVLSLADLLDGAAGRRPRTSSRPTPRGPPPSPGLFYPGSADEIDPDARHDAPRPAQARTLGRRDGAARRLDLLGPAGRRGPQPHRDPQPRHRLLAQAQRPAAPIGPSRPNSRWQLPGRDVASDPGAGRAAGRVDRRAGTRRGVAPRGARDRGPVADPRPTRARRPGGRHRHARRRLAGAGALRRATGRRAPRRCPSRRFWSSRPT